jgi:hypothetical protein
MRGFTWSAIGIEAVPQERIRTAEELGVHRHQIAAAISEQRPSVCRTFDCRVFAAMGLVERCGPNHQTPGWEFAEC